MYVANKNSNICRNAREIMCVKISKQFLKIKVAVGFGIIGNGVAVGWQCRAIETAAIATPSLLECFLVFYETRYKMFNNPSR